MLDLHLYFQILLKILSLMTLVQKSCYVLKTISFLLYHGKGL